jgi:acetylornithine deacetylase/succinyl-diaminopimelate desuccinylase-like protein
MDMGEETAVAADGLGVQAVDLLGELIRADTRNPPGNEIAAQELLAARLSDAGFECSLLAAVEGRPNLVATLAGEAPGPALCLLGHVDVVPADPEEWSFDPLSGDVADGEIRGRGALDMKGQVAAEVAAVARLASDGWRPARGELKLVATADEERGAAFGAAWLCSEHPDLVRADMVVNEGGGDSFALGDRCFHTLCVGEKGVNRFVLRALGAAGHASVPGLGDNALLKLAPALAALRQQPAMEPTPDGIAFLSALLDEDLSGADAGRLEGAVERLRGMSPAIATYIAEPMLRVTMVPTKARASEKANVVPSRAEVLVDSRVPPGGGEQEVRARLAEVLGPLDGEYEVEFTERTTGNRSEPESELADAIAAWLAGVDPEAKLVPIVMAGFSDSHWFRKAFDSAAVYGFCPRRAQDLFAATPLIHAPDERAAVADIELAADFYTDVCRRILG